MGNQKKGNGKTIIIVILTLAVLGLGGYITYDKMNENSKTNSLEKEVKQLKNEITTLKTEKKENEIQKAEQKEENTTTENNNYINAVYYGYEDNEAQNYQSNTIITLFDDGSYVMLRIRSEGEKGTYEINGNQLILHNIIDLSPGDTTYEISADKTQIKAQNGFTLKKE